MAIESKIYYKIFLNFEEIQESVFLFLITFIKLFISYWVIADEQHCDSSRWTAEGLSHIYTCVHSLSNSHRSRLPHDIEQSSLCCPVDACWLSILNTAVCTKKTLLFNGGLQSLNVSALFTLHSYILCSQRWRSSIHSAKQDQELTVAQIMNSLLPNSDWNWRK